MKPTLVFFPDGTQINLEKNKLIQKSSERFLEVSNSKTWKFQLLPNWLDNVAYWYVKEHQKNLPKKYYYYDRGTIIRVDFGVNMGSEFCGLHFAIVLDKKDNYQKKTLTVVPLTSKDKNGRFSLGKEIFNQTTNILKQQINDLKQDFNLIVHKQKNTADIIQQINRNAEKINSLAKVVNIYSRYNKDTYARLSDITTISKLRIRRINKYDPSGKIKLSSQQMASISNELMKLYITK